jgi:uncharacterized membrane protein YfcA
MPEAAGFSLSAVSIQTLVLVAAVAYLSSVLGGLAGTGVGMLMLPLLVPVVGIKGVVPAISVAMLLGSASRLWVFRKSVNWAFVPRLLVGSIPGVILGAAIYDWLSPRALYGLIGTFLVLAVPARRWFARREKVVKTGPAGTAGLGLGYGVISGALAGGGPLLVALLLGMGLRGAAVIGTKAGVSIFMHWTKTIAFGVYGLLNVELVIAAFLIGACTLPGAYTAKWMVDRMNIRMHTAIIEVAIVVGGISLLWRLIE